MPWFVNASSDLPCAEVYREKTEEILALNESAWRRRAQHIPAEDRALSDALCAKGMTHYAIRYNPFMGVISDYFTTDG
jgi:hypothetical protein